MILAVFVTTDTTVFAANTLLHNTLHLRGREERQERGDMNREMRGREERQERGDMNREMRGREERQERGDMNREMRGRRGRREGT